MVPLVITLDHIEHACKEMECPTQYRLFGGRMWEDELSRHHPDAWIALINELHSPHNNVMRRLLALACHPVLDARGGTLPPMAMERWEGLWGAYVPQKKAVVELVVDAIAGDLLIKMTAHHPYWAEIFSSNLQQEPMPPECKFTVCRFALFLLQAHEAASSDDSEIDQSDLVFFVEDTPSKPHAKPPETPDDSPSGDRPAQQNKKASGDDRALHPILDTHISFDDFGGYHAIVEQLKAIGDAFLRPQLWKNWGSRPVRGLLLDGPPGNGKTELFMALATYIRKPLYLVNISQVTSAYINLSAQYISYAFDVARGCLLVFDEAETIIRSRKMFGSHAEDDKMVSVFNVRMQQRALEQDDTLVGFGTNLCEHLDEATIRAGRVDRIIHVPLPNAADRGEVFARRARQAEREAGRMLFVRPIGKQVVEATDKMSCADIVETIRRVLDRKALDDKDGMAPGSVTVDDLLAVIREQRRERAMSGARIGFASAPLKAV